jgi:dTDP-4-amino-4,6-dideoxygalactose transaminase
MIAGGLPAIAGGTPVRSVSLPYGRHTLEGADVDAVTAALRSGSLTGGDYVALFEEALAGVCGTLHAVAVTNGTAAIQLALTALGVKAGDEVITSPLTFVATANAVLHLGGVPVFADIGDDRCLDPRSVQRCVTGRTKAVIVVDYAGLPADVDALRRLLPRDVPIVVDGAHSLGGRLRDRPVGSLGEITTLSFHPVKHVTTGEGGACVTNDARLAERIQQLRNHGMTSAAAKRTGRHWRYDVTDLGGNHRLTDIQAALGLSQLRRLGDILTRRRVLATRYDTLLRPLSGLHLPPRRPDRSSAWHLYAIEVEEAAFGCSRDNLIDALRAEGIEATLHYPAVHLLTLYRSLGYAPGLCPAAENVCSRLVTLPLFPDMHESDQDDVVTALARIHDWASERAAV